MNLFRKYLIRWEKLFHLAKSDIMDFKLAIYPENSVERIPAGTEEILLVRPLKREKFNS